MPTATLDIERQLASPGSLIAGIDEVGRGALAGPVCVGVAVVDPHAAGPVPHGLTDSKLLSRGRRSALVDSIGAWVVAASVGFASAVEIDAIGIVAALRRAAERALAEVGHVDLCLLDGSHNWLQRPETLMLPIPRDFDDPHPDHDASVPPAPPAVTRVKADVGCASVSAASVLAKVRRDAYMTEAAAMHPMFGWAANKGYAASQHRDAIRAWGPTHEHRRSWALLPGLDGSDVD